MRQKHTSGADRHKLSIIDIENRLAVCSVCGETNIYLKNNRPRCATKISCDQMGLGYYIGLKDLERLIGPKPSVCEVCGVGERIVVDHDHSTNQIRGWLCGNCNIALGYLRDNPDAVLRLYEYIKTKKETH